VGFGRTLTPAPCRIGSSSSSPCAAASARGPWTIPAARGGGGYIDHEEQTFNRRFSLTMLYHALMILTLISQKTMATA
jgi:hypothetical protein